MSAALDLRGIVKRFQGRAAVDGVSLSVAPGEVLALVGENGAGKSTLINVATGLYRADAGEVTAFGEVLPSGDPRAAIDAGVGVVHQHFMLVGPLSVWENVVLGREPRRGGALGLIGVVDRERARREVAETARKLRLAIDPDAPVERLGVAAQQRVEIVKQIWRGARVLILDEPTAVLSPTEADALVASIRELARAGRAVLFVSHKLREVLAVADRVAVLRHGRLVREVASSAASAPQLADAMMGSASATDGRRGAPAVERRRPALLRVSGLECLSERGTPALRGLSLELASGEIAAIAGVDGNGQAELAEVLTGLRVSTGSLVLDGEEGLGARGWARSPHAARAARVVHLPEDRRRRALCLPLSLEENAALGWQRMSPWAQGRRIDRAGRRARTAELLRDFDVRPRDPELRASALSGGNQQKLVAARELAGGPPPRLVVAVHPTRGLDVGAAARIHDALRAARDANAAVVIVSLDLDELRALACRILVMFEGRIAGEVPPDAPDEMLGALMLGQRPAHA